MKIVILCGGLGTRINTQGEQRPKPMVEIGGKAILWHIMKLYAHFGFCDFILCLGFQGQQIRQYFLNYELINNDFTVCLGEQKGDYAAARLQTRHLEKGWNVTMVDTGECTQTGARLKKIEPYIADDVFMVTYGDGLADIDIQRLLAFHEREGRVGTVTGVHPASRFGELIIEGSQVRRFSEKPRTTTGFINGGFFVFNRAFFTYLSDAENCHLEHEPLEKLARDGQLSVYRHEHFWQCMDTRRELDYLNKLWTSNSAPWKLWDENKQKVLEEQTGNLSLEV